MVPVEQRTDFKIAQTEGAEMLIERAPSSRDGAMPVTPQDLRAWNAELLAKGVHVREEPALLQPRLHGGAHDSPPKGRKYELLDFLGSPVGLMVCATHTPTRFLRRQVHFATRPFNP